jgi:hypothetical protein
VPGIQVDHGAVVMTEMSKQPPEPLGAAHVSVGDDEDAFADSRTRGSRGEVLRLGERMATTRARRRGEVLVHVQERRSWNVPTQVELAAGVPNDGPELPPAVDELVAHGPIVTRPACGGV